MVTKPKAPTKGSPELDTELEAVYEAFPEIRTVDPAAVQIRMGERIRKATSLDELFDSLSGSTSNALIGKTFKFLSVAWQPYEAVRDDEVKIIPLAVCSVVNADTGEEEEFATTGGLMVEFLRQAEILKVYPFKARIVGKKTRSGQTALNLERA